MLSNAPVFATIPCVDLAGAREFYGQTLGLAEIESFDDEASPAVLYQGGQGTSLLVYQRSTPTKADHTAASWAVEDLDAAADYLINKGVKFLVYEDMPGVEWDERGVATMGDLRSAWFTDPEGNILSVAQMP
jgi:catechol 2,3-dioxygenase-like lactoylglutathione lyase family enzyme